MIKPINKVKQSAIMLMAAAMMLTPIGGAFEGAVSSVYAAGESDLDQDLLDSDKHTETDATDNDSDTNTDPSDFGDGNPFESISFLDLYKEGVISATNKKIDFEEAEDGLHVSAKNKNMQGQYIVIEKVFDFGENEGGMLHFNAVSKMGTKVKARFFIDDATEPFAEIVLPMQRQKNVWPTDQDSLVNLPTSVPAGKHTISIELYDADTSADKKTEVSLMDMYFFRKSGIPVVDLKIDESYVPISEMNNDMNHMTECYGKVNIAVPEGYKSEYSDEGQTEYTGGEYKLEYIRGRGNSTWWAAKKPYKIKLEEGANLFGMGTNKHWTLIANYYDNSLVRNRITYYLGQKLGMEYTPQLVPVDVCMNGNYIGSYFLCEQIRVDESRVDIDDLEEIASDDENITGGYLLGLEPYGDEEGYQFYSKEKVGFVVESPEEISNKKVSASKLDEMNEYIENYVNKTEEAIFGEDFKDSEGKSYTEYMDLDSAAKYYLIQEFTQNGDAFGSPSTYMYKKRDGKLYWGPLWDFDYVAWDSTDYHDYDEFEASYAGFYHLSPWFNRLVFDEEFVAKLKEVWGGKDSTDPNTLAYQLKELTKEGGILDQYEAEMSVSAENNFKVWDFTQFYSNNMFGSGEYNGPGAYGPGEYGPGNTDNYTLIGDDDQPISIPKSMVESGYASPFVNDESITQCTTYHEEIERLRKWINKRIEWVDANFDDISGTTYTVNFYNEDNELIAKKEANELTPFIDLPEEPTKDDYTFIGWYAHLDPETMDEFEQFFYEDGEVKVYSGIYMWRDMDVYAKWIKNSDIVPVKKIHVLSNEVYYPCPAQAGFNFDVIPYNAFREDAVIESSDPDIVYVENGLMFTGAKPGDAELTIKIGDVEEKITVHTLPFEQFMTYYFNSMEYHVDQTKYELNAGECIIPNYEFVGDGLNDGFMIDPISEDSSIAEMSPCGTIYAHAPGTTKITVQGDGITNKVEIEVVVKDGNGSNDYEIVDDSKNDDKHTATDADKKNDADNKDTKDSKNNVTDSKKDDSKVDNKSDNNSNKNDSDNKSSKNSVSELKVGAQFNSGNLRYEVVKAAKVKKGKKTAGTVKVVGVTSDKKKAKKVTKVTIPATVTSDNKTFKVVKVDNKAFTGSEKITTVTIGKNVTSVGKCAFSDCEKLKKVTFNTTNVKFGKKAFNGTAVGIKAYVPASKVKTYKKRLAKVGIKKENVVKKTTKKVEKKNKKKEK